MAIGRHVFVADDTATWDGKAGCARCPLPERHEIHQMPEQTQEQTDHEARRIGERR